MIEFGEQHSHVVHDLQKKLPEELFYDIRSGLPLTKIRKKMRGYKQIKFFGVGSGHRGKGARMAVEYDDYDLNYLHYAAFYNRPDLIRMLVIEMGVNVDVLGMTSQIEGNRYREFREKGGVSPLYVAAKQGSYESVKTLLELGAEKSQFVRRVARGREEKCIKQHKYGRRMKDLTLDALSSFRKKKIVEKENYLLREECEKLLKKKNGEISELRKKLGERSEVKMEPVSVSGGNVVSHDMKKLKQDNVKMESQLQICQLKLRNQKKEIDRLRGVLRAENNRNKNLQEKKKKHDEMANSLKRKNKRIDDFARESKYHKREMAEILREREESRKSIEVYRKEMEACREERNQFTKETEEYIQTISTLKANFEKEKATLNGTIGSNQTKIQSLETNLGEVTEELNTLKRRRAVIRESNKRRKVERFDFD